MATVTFDKNKLKKIMSDPIDDSTIKEYLGTDTPVIAYDALSNYQTIDELLPNNKTYCVVLYLENSNSGHWVGLLRYNNTFEYFDPYGNYIDEPLSWIGAGVRKELNVNKPYLTNLLKKTNLKIIWNKKDFQKENKTIATCGRHCINRILTNKKADLNLKKYTQFMELLKKETNLNYDQLVSELIDKID
jgi:hypothetical protein